MGGLSREEFEDGFIFLEFRVNMPCRAIHDCVDLPQAEIALLQVLFWYQDLFGAVLPALVLEDFLPLKRELRRPFLEPSGLARAR